MDVELNIESQEIKAKKRKLKAVWTYEAQQDMNAFLNVPYFDEAKKFTPTHKDPKHKAGVVSILQKYPWLRKKNG